MILLKYTSGVVLLREKIPISYLCVYPWLSTIPLLAFIIFMHACILGVFVELRGTLLNWKKERGVWLGLVCMDGSILEFDDGMDDGMGELELELDLELH
jgi:hypothetical protein